VKKVLTSLIDVEFPTQLEPHKEASFPSFTPHLTLTSGIVVPPDDPQAWLDFLELPQAEDVRIVFADLASGDQWTKNLFLRAEKEPLRKVGMVCRSALEKMNGNSEEKARRWVEEEWDPHVSLV
jgi:2',3'-cyclic-nucleotide 3'-phosphodiesterase